MCYLGAYLRCEQVLNPFKRSLQGQSSDEEDGEDQVGQSGGDVNSLAGNGMIASA